MVPWMVNNQGFTKSCVTLIAVIAAVDAAVVVIVVVVVVVVVIVVIIVVMAGDEERALFFSYNRYSYFACVYLPWLPLTCQQMCQQGIPCQDLVL